jgi:ATP-dependent DNA helicase HFM1/MER3
VKGGDAVRVKVKADIGLANEKPPAMLRGKYIFVCFVAETSDGHLAEFGRFRYVITYGRWN